MKRFTLPTKLQNPKALTLTLFVVGFAAVGSYMLFRSFALGTSTISGYAFQDTNRNGVKDAGEAPWAAHRLYLMNADQTMWIAGVDTDANGYYAFNNLADGDYTVQYESSSWSNIKKDWVPTTTASLFPVLKVHVTGSGTANFGWRQIVRSTDVNNPISTVTNSRGTRIYSYNDAVTAAEISNRLDQGALFGGEAPLTKIYFDVNAGGSCVTSYSGGPGSYSGFSASMWIPYISWLDPQHQDSTLFHEYGHAFTTYHELIVQQDGNWTSYLRARGITGDPRLYTNKNWDPGEMIADDYRRLFGSESGRQFLSFAGQDNTQPPSLPQPEDVPGLADWFRTTFMKSPVSTTPPAPSAPLTATATLSNEGPAVQLSWGASAGAASYDVYRNGAKIGSVNAPSTTYYDGNGLSYATGYSYYIKPLSSTGTTGPASNTVTVTTPAPDTTKPTTPGNLSSPSQTQTSINLTWGVSTDNIGVAGYKVYQVGGSRKNQYTTLLTTTTNTSFTVTGLKRGTFYSFYVTAIDAAGNESLPTTTLTVKTKR